MCVLHFFSLCLRSNSNRKYYCAHHSIINYIHIGYNKKVEKGSLLLNIPSGCRRVWIRYEILELLCWSHKGHSRTLYWKELVLLEDKMWNMLGNICNENYWNVPTYNKQLQQLLIQLFPVPLRRNHKLHWGTLFLHFSAVQGSKRNHIQLQFWYMLIHNCSKMLFENQHLKDKDGNGIILMDVA